MVTHTQAPPHSDAGRFDTTIGSETEAERIGKLVGARMLDGDEATKSILLEAARSQGLSIPSVMHTARYTVRVARIQAARARARVRLGGA
ncbi:MAG: hypothetical protein COA94_06115 [Rickettsiales bacterium]|nr:MAG: hypothetical protein COA94_06115 [Rickettsiales bacterium]